MIVGIRASRMVRTKAESARAYRETIGDIWTDFVEAIYRKCKQTWGYRLPSSSIDRHALREFGARMLDFENYYLMIHRDWLLERSRRSDVEAQRFMAARFGEVLFPDPAVRTVLSHYSVHSDPTVRDAAVLALSRSDAISDEYGAS